MSESAIHQPLPAAEKQRIDISVIVPFYNSQAHIRQCVAGLLSQSYPAPQYEIILVDNNSNDSSAAIVRQYTRIQLVSETKQGPYAARNKGASLARGSILVFTDADCVPCTEWLNELWTAMHSPEVQLVQGSRSYGAASRWLFLAQDYEAARAAFTFSGSAREILYGYTNNMAVRREAFTECGPFLEIMRGADSLFVQRVVSRYSCVAIGYAPAASVRHCEITTLRKWLSKKFIYGRSFQMNYERRKSSHRWLTPAETRAILQRTVELNGYSSLRVAQLTVVQGLGTLSYLLGRLSFKCGQSVQTSAGRVFSTVGASVRWLYHSACRLAALRRTSNALFAAVPNVNHADVRVDAKRALLIYITKPFLLPAGDSRHLTHQNSRQCKQIAALLDEFGYIVDAVDIRDKTFLPSARYDLVIANRVNLFAMDRHFGENTIRIALATVTNHRVHNRSLQRRHSRLAERRKCTVSVRRPYAEFMPFITKSDAIIGFGNDFITGTWREVFPGPIYSFNNYGFKETPFLLEGKDFRAARNHFLFFASGSQIQKGLDLLLEIFSKLPNLHLYVCSNFQKEPDFCACYERELFQTPNIHPRGWVQVNGREYRELVRTCAYVILPTCSEGQPGSVVQCMYSGLIPLVTEQAGIDTEDFGITFASDEMSEIERVILEVSQLPEEWHRERSIRTRKVAEEKYSESAFENRWRKILTQVLAFSHTASR